MKRVFVLAACLVMPVLLSGAVRSAGIVDSIWGDGLDEATMVSLLERGQLILVERDALAPDEEVTRAYRNVVQHRSLGT